MIEPTVGRVVWFYPGSYDSLYGGTGQRPKAAIVAYVHSDRMVNLSVCDSNGNWHSRTSIRLFQPEDEVDQENTYCVWMPYQIGQAAKTEQLAEKLAERAGQ